MKNIILIQKDFNKLKTEVKKNSDNNIIFTSEDDELNRKVLEKLKIQILMINQKNRKDFSKQRNSGFNQVLAKIAKKNKISIGINLDEIIQTKGKAEVISRIKQNIRLCNKYKIQMHFISQSKKNKRNIYDLKSLGLVLGMPTWMTKNIQTFFN